MIDDSLESLNEMVNKIRTEKGLKTPLKFGVYSNNLIVNNQKDSSVSTVFHCNTKRELYEKIYAILSLNYYISKPLDHLFN